MTLTRPTRCEVCGAVLCRRGIAATGLCARCRSEGAEFMRTWANDLAQQMPTAQIAEVLGTTTATVRARIREHRVLEASRRLLER